MGVWPFLRVYYCNQEIRFLSGQKALFQQKYLNDVFVGGERFFGIYFAVLITDVGVSIRFDVAYWLLVRRLDVDTRFVEDQRPAQRTFE
jgi:hypothetical protein